MVLAHWRIWNWRLTDHTWSGTGTLEHTENVSFLIHYCMAGALGIEWNGMDIINDGWMEVW